MAGAELLSSFIFICLLLWLALCWPLPLLLFGRLSVALGKKKQAGQISKKVLAAMGGGTSAIALATVMVADFEGKRNDAYLDPVGVPTICYGHTQGVKLGQTLSDAECERLLAKDLGYFHDAVSRLVVVPLPETRHAALTSFAYHIGVPAFSKSTLLKKLNRGDALGACAQISRWPYTGGRILPGVVIRRAKERGVCEAGLPCSQLPADSLAVVNKWCTP